MTLKVDRIDTDIRILMIEINQIETVILPEDMLNLTGYGM